MTFFNAWKKEDRDAAMICAQNKCIVILCFGCLLLSIGWISAPSRIQVFIPPDMSAGATLKPGEIPPALIYSFADELWQEINYWAEDGSKDYEKNLRTYAAYLTPEFQAELFQELHELMDAGQLQRQRYLQGSAFEVSHVKKLSSDSWAVDLKVRLMEYKNHQLVKDIEVLYPLKIVRRDISHSHNPYGLAIAGFVSKPIRVAFLEK